VTRCLAMFVAGVFVLTGPGCGSSTTSPSSAQPRNVTMTFNARTTNGATVSIFSESGFLISANLDSWVALTTYGNPAPFIEFRASATGSVTGEIQVWADGHAPFGFKSIDLYSSVTKIPYVMTGVRGVTNVFTLADTLPNTFGAFRTVVNPHGAHLIDTLTVSLSNSNAPNPMGLDNIVLSQ
jgi:hypothetical protein